MCQGTIFLILTFFNLFLKITPGELFFAPDDPFGRAWRRGAAASLCRATCGGAAALPR
jgi:hypothetical protein